MNSLHQRTAATALAVAGLLVLSIAGAGADPADTPIGPGCAAYAPVVLTGPGSMADMAQLPLTVAASRNPKLTALSAALSGKLNPAVNLVDTLDGGQFTVFAPVDSAIYLSRVRPTAS